MNFSELFKQTNQLSRFSPNGKYIANCVQYRLLVRDVKSLQILQLYTCLDVVQCIEWSSDSLYILCGMFKRGVIQLRISVWSLVSKSVSYIKYPKHANAGLEFRTDGKYMALAERRNCKDCISIFSCSVWQLVKHFEVDTKDLADLAWSPDGRVLCVWDSVLRYELLLYSLDGRCLSRYSAYEFALGIKSLCWSPSSQFLAIGSFDEKCRVLNHVTWKLVAEHQHQHSVESPTAIVYKEIELKPPLLRGEMMPPGGFTVQSKYEVQPVPIQVPSVKPDPEKPNPKLGVGQIAFSGDNRYLATKNVWLWDVSKLCLAALLLQSKPVKAFQWDPKQPRLAICTANNKLYMWSPAGCVSVVVPTEVPFQVTSLQFHPDGNLLMLMSKDQMCLCFLTNPRT
ncbi:WD repeat-containing protein WRAP73 [Acropora cervicornis]|uniref:WD repeat-containing protein WRAP73 n=1 Tax=Acropora cervicornis TaxID=6130 RepID=A0AAD9QAE2_ACRCE|nr:WD repeat-containing protein WRAP73 [Acropora cervicornis]